MTFPEKEPKTAYEASLRRISDLARWRQDNLGDLPTIASEEILLRGIRNLITELPERGLGLESTMDHLLQEVLPTLAQGHSGPRYFGFVTGGCLLSAQLADMLVTLLDSNVQVHLIKETLATLVEHHALNLVLDLLELPRSDFAGTFTTGATASNILGLACGRESVLERVMRSNDEAKDSETGAFSLAEQGFGPGVAKVKVLTTRPHASIKKAAAIVGIGRANVLETSMTSNSDPLLEPGSEDLFTCLDFDLDELERRLSESKQKGEAPIVVLGMGEVNTGALTTQTPQVRALCDKYGAWLHVDAAFSAFMNLVPGYEWVSHHLAMADSITTDGHKQLNVPYDCGIFFVKKPQPCQVTEDSILEEVFGTGKGGGPAYLSAGPGDPEGEDEDEEEEGEEGPQLTRRLAYARGLPSPLVRNIENSRRFRALPVYAALLSQGREGYQEIVRRNVDFARSIESWLRESEARAKLYQVLTPMPSEERKVDSVGQNHDVFNTTVVLFRPHPECPNTRFRGVDGHLRLVDAIKKTAKVYVSPTSWQGLGAVRLAVSNWSTGLELDRDGQSEDLETTKRVLEGVMLAAM